MKKILLCVSLLAVFAAGFAGCSQRREWNREERKAMRDALHLPQYVVPACMLVFGRPTEQQQRRPKPARFAEQAVVCENVYTDRTPDELRADFAAKAAANGQLDYDFDKAVQAFCKRKYASDFSREMTRSAEIYWKEFL